MATNSAEEKWEGSNSDQEEEEEALSLCDLPLNLINKENQSSKEEVQASKTEEDFDFGSWGASLSKEPEMCAADDVFFKGQILPSRLSVSSESGLTRTQNQSQNPSRCVSRSESMDHGSLGRFTSNSSSRSSSTRSHYSSSSTSTSSTNTTKTLKPRIQNNFHTHPSPKPQIKVTSTRPGNVSNRTQKSSAWDFFRLGLVRTPEIELLDLKVRSSVSRNSSSSSNNSSCSIKNGTKIIDGSNYGEKSNHGLNMEKQKRQSLLDKRRNGLFGGGCKCSVSAVEAVPLNNIVIIKSCTNGATNSNKSPSSSTHDMKEKLQELKQKQQQGKQSMSRHRTFEWLKELSHASYPDEA